MLVNCRVCNKEVVKSPFYVKKFHGNVYCSMSCYHKKLKERFPEVTSICLECGQSFKIYPSDKTLDRGKYCSKKCKDKRQRGINSPVWKEKPILRCLNCKKEFTIDNWRLNDKITNRGQFCSVDCRSQYLVGEHSSNWVGGITKENHRIRSSRIYQKWRLAVLERDKYKCVVCSSTEKLEVDHIKQFALYPNVRLDIDNGRTLCHNCHKKTPSHQKGLSKATRNLLTM